MQNHPLPLHCHTLALLALPHLQCSSAHLSARPRPPKPKPDSLALWSSPTALRCVAFVRVRRERTLHCKFAMQPFELHSQCGLSLRPSLRPPVRPHFAGLGCLCVLTTTAPQSGLTDAVATCSSLYDDFIRIIACKTASKARKLPRVLFDICS